MHYTTVSLALRNHPSIPAATRARIRAAAEALGYRPDPMLASLALYRHSLRRKPNGPVALWVTNYPTRMGWRKPKIFVEYFEGARERAEQLGFRLEEFWARETGMTPARLAQIVRARGVHAVLLAPQPRAGAEISLPWDELSAVTIGYTLSSPRLHLVCNHQFASMRLLMRELLTLGYRRIGLALPSIVDHRVDRNWLGGFLTEQVDLPAKNRVPPFLFDTFSEAELKRWLGRHRPDALVSPIAVDEPVWHAVQRLGYRVPEDIGFAFPSLHDLREGRAGVHENSRAIGAAAMDLLSGLWQRSERGVPVLPLRELVEGVWVSGWTVRRQD